MSDSVSSTFMYNVHKYISTVHSTVQAYKIYCNYKFWYIDLYKYLWINMQYTEQYYTDYIVQKNCPDIGLKTNEKSLYNYRKS